VITLSQVFPFSSASLFLASFVLLLQNVSSLCGNMKRSLFQFDFLTFSFWSLQSEFYHTLDDLGPVRIPSLRVFFLFPLFDLQRVLFLFLGFFDRVLFDGFSLLWPQIVCDRTFRLVDRDGSRQFAYRILELRNQGNHIYSRLISGSILSLDLLNRIFRYNRDRFMFPQRLETF